MPPECHTWSGQLLGTNVYLIVLEGEYDNDNDNENYYDDDSFLSCKVNLTSLEVAGLNTIGLAPWVGSTGKLLRILIMPLGVFGRTM